MLDGKFAHRLLPRPQADAMREAIANYHTVQALLKDWVNANFLRAKSRP